MPHALLGVGSRSSLTAGTSHHHANRICLGSNQSRGFGWALLVCMSLALLPLLAYVHLYKQQALQILPEQQSSARLTLFNATVGLRQSRLYQGHGI